MSVEKIRKIMQTLKRKGYEKEVTAKDLDLAIIEGAGVIHWQTRKNYIKLMESLEFIKPKLVDEDGKVLVYEICQS